MSDNYGDKSGQKPSADEESIPRSVRSSVPTPTEDEVMGTLERVAREGRAQCRLCDHWVEGDSFDEIFEKLAEHGEEAHDWGDRDGWSA